MSPEQFFGGAPQAWASAPGRVNLLGEHTDYNDGFMLPVATPQRTEVALAPSQDGAHVAYSVNLSRSARWAPMHTAPEGFARYLDGCLRVLAEANIVLPPLRIYVRSNLPLGAGLSSSAALEVAMLRACCALTGADLAPVHMAQLAQQAEWHFAGVQCGILDQMAACLADTERALLIDARSLAWRRVPLPPDTAVIVLDTGVARLLANSAYNQRRRECREAAEALGLHSLRDVSDMRAVEALPSPLRERARHVVSENTRVQEAASGVSAARFGALMNASHASLRDDFAVSHPALDALSDLLRASPGVYGARLTGAGFGGACVALCAAGKATAAAQQALAQYASQGGDGHQWLPEPERGEHEPV